MTTWRAEPRPRTWSTSRSGAFVAAGDDGVVGVATAVRGAAGEPPAHALTRARQTTAMHAPVLLTRSTLTGNAGQEVSDAASARRGRIDPAGGRRRRLPGRHVVVTLRPDAAGLDGDAHADECADAVCPPAEEEAFARRARGRDADGRWIYLPHRGCHVSTARQELAQGLPRRAQKARGGDDDLLGLRPRRALRHAHRQSRCPHAGGVRV